MKNINKFWTILDKIVANAEIVIDEPKGSSLKKMGIKFPLAHGHLRLHNVTQNNDFNLWQGSGSSHELVGLILVANQEKQKIDFELLLGCTQNEKKTAFDFYKKIKGKSGLLINRK